MQILDVKQPDGNTTTMSSREIAEGLAAHLLAGTASKASAYEAAFMMVGNAALTLNKHLEHDVPNMSSGEARAALDLIESGREILKSARGVFDKYPFASAVIDAQLSVMFYAEATLIPFYLMCSRDALKNKKELASTYIVKHPITGLIKIGRANNVGQRVKSLQTGAGAILSTLAVIRDDVELELHRRFSAYRRHGEWFEDIDGVISTFASDLKEVAL